MRGRLQRATWRHDPALYAPARHRRACSYEAFVPDRVADLDHEMPADLAGVVADAEAAVRALNDRARPALAPLARLLLRTESIASSRVEGLQVDARDLARAEARTDEGRDVRSAASEILANIDAMELAVLEAGQLQDVGIATLTSIHAALMSRAPNSRIAGRLRDQQNWIGGNPYNPCGAAFVPPPPGEVGRLLEDLVEAVHDEHLPPLVQAAVVHAQFETIHPFDDGNGRTGRALIHVVLRRRGTALEYVPPVSVLMASDKEAYIRGLEAYREGELDSWIRYFAVTTARAARLAQGYLREVDRLQDGWRVRLTDAGGPRSDAAAWRILDVLPAHPVLTVPVAVAATGRTKAAVGQAMLQLEAAGVLHPLSQGRRNRSWEADGLLDLLADLEAGIHLRP